MKKGSKKPDVENLPPREDQGKARDKAGDAHKTFEDYCKAKWEFSRGRAGKIEQKLLAHDESVPIGTPATHTAPVKESHVRPLAGLNENQQVKAYTDAKADAEKAGKPLTAKDVKAKADTYKPAAPKPQPAPKTCPKCKGEDFHKDGTCAVCVQEDAPEPDKTKALKLLGQLVRELDALAIEWQKLTLQQVKDALK